MVTIRSGEWVARIMRPNVLVQICGTHSVSSRDFVAIAALSIVFSVVLLWSLGDAYLWEIDDEEILRLGLIISDQGGLSWKSFFVALMQTEVGPYVDLARYRPVFYVFRILKGVVLVLMGNLSWLFAFHVCAFIVFFSAVGICIKRYFSWFWVVIGLFSLAAMPFHAGVWWWLSVPEVDVMVWLAPVLLGLFWHDSTHRWAWPALCVGSALAIGTKENFILLLIPMGYLMWQDWRHGRLRIPQIVWLLIPLVMSAPVAFTLLKVIFIKGSDVYGVSTGGGAVQSLALYFVSSMGAFFCYGLVLTLFFLRKRIQDRKALHNSVAAIAIIFLFMLGNYIFYRGQDVGGFHRYGFPYQALFLLGFFVFLWPLKTLDDQFLYRKIKGVIFIKPPMGAVLVVAALLGFVGVVINSSRIAGDTQRYTKVLEDFLKDARGYKAVAVTSTTIHNPSSALSTFHKAGYLPVPHYYMPLFGDRPAASDASVGLNPDVLLAGFNLPNKKHLLGDFWKRFHYFTHPWTNPHSFQRIEHSNAVRPMASVFADRPFLPLTERGEAVFQDDATLYVPADRPQSGTLLLQTSAPLPTDHCWRFTINGQEVQPNTVPQGLEIAVGAAMWANTPHHPQVLEVGMKCVDIPVQSPLPLRLIALVLNGESS